MSRVYDIFAGEFIDEEDMDPIAPPERYIREKKKEKNVDSSIPAKMLESWEKSDDKVLIQALGTSEQVELIFAQKYSPEEARKILEDLKAGDDFSFSKEAIVGEGGIIELLSNALEVE